MATRAFANVTDDQLRRYLSRYREVYKATVEQFFSPDERTLLQRYSLLDGGIVGYVSTQFGAGFEYLGDASPGLSVRVHSSRVEHLFAGAPARVRKSRAVMIAVAGHNVTVQGLTLEGAFPFRLTSEEADVRFIDVRFRAGAWVRDVVWAELYGNRSAEFWTEARAEERARGADELMIALFQLKEARKRSLSPDQYLAVFRQRHVLLLGDYGDEGAARLAAIGQVLTEVGYVTIMLKDLPDDPYMTLPQKASAFASISRFIVVDDSSKSGHLVEFAQVRAQEWVTLVLRLKGSDSSFMSKGASATSAVVHEADYETGSLRNALLEGVTWAEAKLVELKRVLADTYPWRKA